MQFLKHHEGGALRSQGPDALAQPAAVQGGVGHVALLNDSEFHIMRIGIIILMIGP